MTQARTRVSDWARVPDLELLASIAAGDGRAFVTLVRRHNRNLYRVARSITTDDAEAEDVVQEAWTRAYSSFARFKGEAQLSTWLVRIVINEALARKRRHKPSLELEALDESRAASEVTLPSTTLDQEGDVSRNEVQAMLERAIDSLPPAFRTVFVLHTIEEVSVEEIASQLGISRATVRTRMHRSRMLLRRELEKASSTCLSDVFPFGGERCRAMAQRVLTRTSATNAPPKARSIVQWFRDKINRFWRALPADGLTRR